MSSRRSPLAASLANVAVFIILEAAAALVLSGTNRLQRLWLARFSHGFMAKTWGATQNIRGYFSLRGSNEALARENQSLLERVRRLESQLSRDSVSYSELRGDGFRYTGAEVLRSTSGKQRNYIILGKGSNEGISVNSGVITPRGVIGIVDAVGPRFSYVISFMNADFSISARIGREGSVGPLAWDGIHSDRALLREIPLQFKYEKGDTVYTSGYSTIFPPGIPLGVCGGSRVVNGSVNEVEVALFQDHSAVRYVSVAENLQRGEVEALTESRENSEKQPE